MRHIEHLPQLRQPAGIVLLSANSTNGAQRGALSGTLQSLPGARGRDERILLESQLTGATEGISAPGLIRGRSREVSVGHGSMDDAGDGRAVSSEMQSVRGGASRSMTERRTRQETNAIGDGLQSPLLPCTAEAIREAVRDLHQQIEQRKSVLSGYGIALDDRGSEQLPVIYKLSPGAKSSGRRSDKVKLQRVDSDVCLCYSITVASCPSVNVTNHSGSMDDVRTVSSDPQSMRSAKSQ